MKRVAPLTAGLVLALQVAMSSASPWDDGLAVLRAAAVAGDARALVALGQKYENAEGVAKDQAVARRLYCRAARSGDAEARYRLAWSYANGRGGARDDSAAGALLALAAGQGHAPSATLLARIPAPSDPEVSLPDCMRPDPPALTALADPQSATAQEGTGDETARSRGHAVPPALRRLVGELAPQYAVDAELALAVIAVESAFDPAAVSSRNAQGLMQLIPETAARFGVQRPFDPADNVRGGLAYLRWLLAFFRGDVRLVLAAYNAGERAVERYGGIPPYRETRDYVRRAAALYRRATHPYQPDVAAPSAVLDRRSAGK